MPDFRRAGPALELAAELQELRARCERIGDTLAGLALLFAVVAALTIGGGVWLDAPLFGMSAAFALAAALAFAFAARALARARHAAAPLLASEPPALPRPQPRLHRAA